MNILEKLGVMVEINSRNEARIAQFIKTEKTMKRWKVDYAVMYKTGEIEEDCFIGKAPTLSEMLQDAQKMLDSVAPYHGLCQMDDLGRGYHGRRRTFLIWGASPA